MLTCKTPSEPPLLVPSRPSSIPGHRAELQAAAKPPRSSRGYQTGLPAGTSAGPTINGTVAEERGPWSGPDVWGALGTSGSFFPKARSTRPAHRPPPAAIAVLPVFRGAAHRSLLLRGSQWPHLLGALLEGSRDEMPLLPAPVGQYAHDGSVVHT